MPGSERRRRMVRMRRQIGQSDILRWRDLNFEQICGDEVSENLAA